MDIKLVVFDIAGTTLKDDEDVVARSFNSALREHGFDLKGVDLSPYMGYRKIDAIRMILQEKNIDFEESNINSVHERFIALINEHYTSESIEEIPGASEIFKKLQESDINVAINTGFSRSTTDIIIDKLGWADKKLIDTSVCSDEVSSGRPSADMIHKIMNELDIEDPKMVAKVGDTPSDLMEGETAGCSITVGVLYGTHSRDELQRYHHNHLISDIRELLDILNIN